jgi:hypothetical protein
MELNDAHLPVKLVSTGPTPRVVRPVGDGSGMATVPATCGVASRLS